MTYSRISHKQADQIKDFFTPGLTTQADSDKYLYYMGFDEEAEEITAAAAVDPRLGGLLLLSIGVRPDKQRKGIGSGLMRFLTEDLTGRIRQENQPVRPVLLLQTSLQEKEWEGLDPFLMHNGFVLVEQANLCSVKLSQILESEILKKAAEHFHKEHFRSLKDVPESVIRSFGNRIEQNGIYPGIHPGELDKNLSIVYLENDTIKGCLLMGPTEDGNLLNHWVYLDPELRDRTLLLQMFVMSINAFRTTIRKDVTVYFLPVAEISGKLLNRLAPAAKLEYQIRTYEKSLRDGDTPVFDQVTEKNMICEGCVHSTGCILECARYTKKPGMVLYGGSCKHYEKRQ